MGFFSFFRGKPQAPKSRAQRRRNADNRSLFEKHTSQLPSTSAASQKTPHIIAINPKAHQKLGTNYSHPIKAPPKSSKLSKKQQPKPQPPRKSQISAPQQTPFALQQQRDHRDSASIDPQRAYHSAIRQGYTHSYRQFQPVHPPRPIPVDSAGNSYDLKPLPPVPPPKVALRPGKAVQGRHQHGALASVVHPDHYQGEGKRQGPHDSMRAEVGGWSSKAQEASFRPLSEIGLVGREARGWAEREMGGYFDEEVRKGSVKEYLDGKV